MTSPAEEEADEQRGLEVERILVVLGGRGEGEEEEETADEERRVVRGEDRPAEESQMHHGDPGRHGIGAVAPLPLAAHPASRAAQHRELAAEDRRSR